MSRRVITGSSVSGPPLVWIVLIGFFRKRRDDD
jgi:hypothetical protein